MLLKIMHLLLTVYLCLPLYNHSNYAEANKDNNFQVVYFDAIAVFHLSSPEKQLSQFTYFGEINSDALTRYWLAERISARKRGF